MIAVIYRTEVHKDKLARFKGLIRGNAVGHGGSLAAEGDGLKGKVLRTVSQHIFVESQGNFFFGNALLNEVQRVFKCSLRNALSLGHHAYLFGSFYCSHIGDDAAESIARINIHIGVDAVVKPVKVGNGHGLVLDHQAVSVMLLDKLVQLVIKTLLQNHFAVLNNFPCFFNVSEINDKIRLLGKNDDSSRRGFHSRKIPPVYV